MNWKTAIVLSAFVPLAAAAGGCGSDDCTRASDHKAECTLPSGATSSSGGMTMEACAGAFLCKSQCINQFTCDQINGSFPAYTTCITSCDGK